MPEELWEVESLLDELDLDEVSLVFSDGIDSSLSAPPCSSSYSSWLKRAIARSKVSPSASDSEPDHEESLHEDELLLDEALEEEVVTKTSDTSLESLVVPSLSSAF